MKNYKKNYEYYKVKKVDSIKQLLEFAVSDAGNKIAFKYKEDKQVKEVTYNEFKDDVYSLGTALSSIKMTSAHIAVIGENSYNWLTVYLSVLKSNGVIVPIDKELPLKDIINVLENSDSEVLFYSEKFSNCINEIHEKLPKIKYFIGFSNTKSSNNILSYKDFVESGRKLYKNGDTSYSSIEGDPNELRLLVYTSGTTGMAKGVMLSEHNLVSLVYYGLQVSTVPCSLSSAAINSLSFVSIVNNNFNSIILSKISSIAPSGMLSSLLNLLSGLNIDNFFGAGRLAPLFCISPSQRIY